MSTIVVYSKPNCPQCDATKRWLSVANLAFEVRDVSVSESAHDEVVALGYRSMPVVVFGDENWSGFDPIQLNGLVGRAQRVEDA